MIVVTRLYDHLYFEQNIKICLLKMCIFLQIKNLFTLYKHIFVMYRSRSVAVVDRNYICSAKSVRNVKALRPGKHVRVMYTPLNPTFIQQKMPMGYAGVYLFFLFLLQNIDCGYSLEPPRRGGSNVYPKSMF